MANKAEPATEVVAVTFGGHKGTVHRPVSGLYNGTSVLICSPIGRDRIWTYRTLFLWAEHLASQGFQVLRYDHRGDGDSLDVEAGLAPWKQWVSGVGHAACFVRDQMGANALILAGLRIGGTLACEATAEVKPDALILWDPLPTGTAWLKELRLASAMAAAAKTTDDFIEVNGVRLTADSINCLETVDLTKSAFNYPPTLLASPTTPKKLIQALGSSVRRIPFHGYTKLFKDTYVNSAPLQLFEATDQWLSALRPSAPRIPQIAAYSRSAHFDAVDWTEHSTELDQGLRAILCLPKIRRGSQAVIFCAAAANPRSGDGNFNTLASRSLASEGVAALRLDFSSVGESNSHEGEIHVYETSRIAAMNSAAMMLNEYGYRDLAAIGTCTGGFHAIRAALEGEGIRRAIAINALVYWRVGTPLDRTALVASMRATYLRAPVQLRKWLTIRHRIRAWLMRSVTTVRRTLMPRAAVRITKTEFKRASERGISIKLITGSADWSRETLEEFGARGKWFSSQKGMSVEIIDDLDHSVSMAESQVVVLHEIKTFLSSTGRGAVDGSAQSSSWRSLRPSRREPILG